MTGVGEKADHVRAAIRSGVTGGHVCHWPGCETKCAGCRKHWFMLPASLRSKIWRAYRAGQESDRKVSADYVAVARETRDWIMATHYPEAAKP